MVVPVAEDSPQVTVRARYDARRVEYAQLYVSEGQPLGGYTGLGTGIHHVLVIQPAGVGW